MDVALMIEGQEGVTWQQWQQLATAVDTGGLHGLFRSDHYTSVSQAEDRTTTDAWALLSALSATSDRIRLGTLVSPATFRHPSVLAAMAVTADHVSGGRIEIGMGTGWHEHEHETFGFDFPDMGERFSIFEEQVEIVRRLTSGETVQFDGEHYQLDGAGTLPRPVQQPLPLIVGGLGGPRSVALAARFADEYNTVGADEDELRERYERLQSAWKDEGRDAPLRFSVMAGVLIGADEDGLRDHAQRVQERVGEGGDLDAWLEDKRPDWIVGTVEQVVERVGRLADIGVTRVMLQNLDHENLDVVGLLGRVQAQLS